MTSEPHARLLVCTDISSLTSGLREPDDGQSLIRLLLYSNEIEIEGLIASSNMGHGQICRPELIHQAIDAYAESLANLRLHDPGFPDAARLHNCVRAGQPIAGPAVPPADCIGEGRETEASEWIISRVETSDARPLRIAIWGGSTDLAQALWSMRERHPASTLDSLLARIRVHSVNDQDSTGAWIKEQFPNLWYLTRNHGIRGMYRGGDASLVDSQWVQTNIRGHGALGALYPDYNGGDFISDKLGRVRGIKEGDTPSFLHLIPNGLNQPDQPGLSSWSGRFVEVNPNRWVDGFANSAATSDPDPRMWNVYRWRAAWQNDFAVRLDWCVADLRSANHAPEPVLLLNGQPAPQVVTAGRGEILHLDGSSSTDPDGNGLSFRWWLDLPPESGEVMAGIGPAVHWPVPDSIEPGSSLPLVMEVSDDGTPPLTRYRRVQIQIV